VIKKHFLFNVCNSLVDWKSQTIRPLFGYNAGLNYKSLCINQDPNNGKKNQIFY